MTTVVRDARIDYPLPDAGDIRDATARDGAVKTP